MESPAFSVFYDGACPLCRREISFYQRKNGADSICWIDVSRSQSREIVPGLSKQAALARFHVRDAAGQIFSGGAAFALLWQTLPGSQLLGRLCRTRLAAWALDPAYRIFLKIRPYIQSLFR